MEAVYRQWATEDENGQIRLGPKQKCGTKPYAPPGAGQEDPAEVRWPDGFTWRIPTLPVSRIAKAGPINYGETGNFYWQGEYQVPGAGAGSKLQAAGYTLQGTGRILAT